MFLAGSVPKTSTIRTTELDNDDNVIFLGQKGGTQMTSSLKNNNETDKKRKDSETITVQSENVTAEIVTVRTEPCTDNKLLLYSNSKLLHCAESKLTIGSESKLIPRPGLKLVSLPKEKVEPPPKKKLEPRPDIKLVPRPMSKTVPQPDNELLQRNNITVGSCLPSNHVPNTESKLTKQQEIRLVSRSVIKFVPHSVNQGVSASESIMVSESESDTDTGDDELYLAEEGISDTEMKMTHSAIRQTPSLGINKVTKPDNEQSSTIMSEMVPFPEVRQVPWSMDKQVPHSEICKVQQLEASKIPHHENNEPLSVNDQVPHPEICKVQQLEASKIPHHENNELRCVNDQVPRHPENNHLPHEPHSDNNHVSQPKENCSVIKLEPGADTKQTPPVGIIKIPSSLIQQVPPGDGKAACGPLMFIAYHNGKQVTIQVPYPETGQTLHPETKQMPSEEKKPKHVCEKMSKATTSPPKNLHANQVKVL